MAIQTEPQLHDLLIKTSRTFALSIPPLPEPLRREVTIAYLLFRLADTFEDAANWPVSSRVNALETFRDLLHRPPGVALNAALKVWRKNPKLDHEGYQTLLDDAELVWRALWDLKPSAREAILHHTDRTAERMTQFVEMTASGTLQLQTIEALKDYCYAVAGIVGELLTDLFLLQYPRLEKSSEELRKLSAPFGEALQLVNILKDADRDRTEGRIYLPTKAPHQEVFALAYQDLDLASEYVAHLERCGAPKGLLTFTAMPVLLARATLNHVEARGAGAKLTRDEVKQIINELDATIDQGRLAVKLGVFHGS